jgi:hypothetical protein
MNAAILILTADQKTTEAYATGLKAIRSGDKVLHQIAARLHHAAELAQSDAGNEKMADCHASSARKHLKSA